MEHQEEGRLSPSVPSTFAQFEDQPLAQSGKTDHRPAGRRFKRRLHGSQQERVGQSESEQLLSQDAGAQGLEVSLYIRQFRQGRVVRVS